MNIIRYIKNLFHRTNRAEIELLEGIDLDFLKNPESSDEKLKQRYDEILTKRHQAERKYSDKIDELAMVQKINSIPDKQLSELENLATTYSEKMLELESYRKKAEPETDDSKYLEKYKEDIPRAIRNLTEHEEKQRIIKNDLYQLEGEHAEIRYRIERATKAMEVIRFILIVTSFLAVLTALLLTILYFINDVDVFFPSTVMLIIFMLTGLWLYVFRRYMVFEIKKNQILQKRVIELTNKIKIKYVNVQQFLDYEYTKYQIDSSEILELRWENFNRAKKNEESLRRVSVNLAAIVHDVDRLLLKNNIHSGKYVTDHMDYFSSSKGRDLLLSALENEKKIFKMNYEKCEREVKILQKLMGEKE